MDIQFLYPENKTKALTFSYDDGQIYDRRLVEIFNRYELKGTFHLNSGMLDRDGFVTSDEIKELYKGHEISCHGAVHKYLNHLPAELLFHELWEDRRRLEELSGSIITGMSYAYGEYSDYVVDSLRQIGMKYARTVEASNRFCVPSDFLRWKPTCHHNNDVLDKAEKFLDTPGQKRMLLFYIWGHSFEFERADNWNLIEELCGMVSKQKDVWYVTNKDYYYYVTAMRALVFNLSQTMVYNPSGLAVWFVYNDRIIKVLPGETKNLID